MLILTLKVDEKIFIGSEITVMVVAIKGKEARLGIEAPAVIPVAREKITRKKKT